jgi:hypothetical protein
VLSRDASNRQLPAATDATAIAGLGDRLERAAPRDCLAVPRGGAYAVKQAGRDRVEVAAAGEPTAA